jgi:hypothetical protein
MDGSFLDPGCLDPGRRQDIPMAAAVQHIDDGAAEKNLDW